MSTDNLALPYIMPAQAQKHVTHNEALRRLDALVQIGVVSRTVTAPPEAPASGTRYIVPVSGEGDWDGEPGDLAAWQDGAWQFFVPQAGWLAWVADEAAAFIHDGSTWTPLEGTQLDALPLFGVNASADAGNRLAVKSDAVLLSHDDVTPGSGGIQLKLNKAMSAGTASVLYQTGWSGRAEFGTAGDDNFHIKVSANGSTWREALVIDRATGAVSMPLTPAVANAFNLLKDAGRFGGSPEPVSRQAPDFAAPAYLSAANGAVIAQGPKFIHDNSTFGGAQGALDPDITALISKLKSADSGGVFRRYGIEFHTLEITAGAGTSTVQLIEGTSHYLPFSNAAVPMPADISFNVHVLVKSGSVGVLHAARRTFVDGEEISASRKLLPADGWRQITLHHSYQPDRFIGYDNTAHRLYAAPGSVFLLAAFTITPGHLPMRAGLYYGIVPSLEAWR